MATSSAGTLEELVTCNICLYQYDENSRKPKFLQCGHTICLDCLQAIRQLDTITCPFCRKCTSKDVSNGAEWVLPNNQYALEMLKWTRNASNSLLPTAVTASMESKEEEDEQLMIAMAVSSVETKEEEDEQLMIAMALSSIEIKEEEEASYKAMHQILLNQQKEQEITEKEVTVIPCTQAAEHGGRASVASEIISKIQKNKVAVGYNYPKRVEKHESQVYGSKEQGRKFGVQANRQDAAAVRFNEGQGHVGTVNGKYNVSAENALLKSRLEKFANEKKKPAMANALPSENAHPIAKIAHKFETQSKQPTGPPIRQIPQTVRKSAEVGGWSSVVSEFRSKGLNTKSAVSYSFQDIRLNQTSPAKLSTTPQQVIRENRLISPVSEH